MMALFDPGIFDPKVFDTKPTVPRRAYFRIVGMEGDGTEDNPCRPAHLDHPGITGWAATYKRDTQDSAIVLVQGLPGSLSTLIGQPGVTMLANLTDTRAHVGEPRASVKAALVAYAGTATADWHTTMVGNPEVDD